MNRYSSVRPSKASANTLCQKCLKRGHYSYECTESRQDRPYISRPSRTQQLLNPKLAPKLSETVLEPLQSEREKGPRSKNITTNEGPDRTRDQRRQRSVSSSSFDSVSTISTNRSRSRSPPPGSRKGATHRSERGVTRSRSRDHLPAKGAVRDDAEYRARSSRRGGRSRKSPSLNRSRSRSPVSRDKRTRQSDPPPKYRSRSPARARADRASPVPRDGSLSPYSRRLALTNSTNRS